MPVIAILLGIVLVILAFRGTEHVFADQLSQDFSGGSFWSWLAAICIIGAIGYYKPAAKVSDLGVGLVVLVMILKNGGVFDQFSQIITKPPAPSQSVPMPTLQTGSSGGGGGLFGGALGALSSAKSIASVVGL